MAVNQHSHKPPHLQLPNFEPLPTDKWYNRLINNLLKPIFYLFFTLITSIIVIPIYTIIENLNERNRAKRGERRGGHSSNYTVNGQPVEQHDGKMQTFLKGYGGSYGGEKHHARR